MDKSKGRSEDGIWVEEVDTSEGTIRFESASSAVRLDPPENTVGFKKMVKQSSITTVIIAGIALFSDGYTAQIGKSHFLAS
jgi:hypothetical protein